MRFRFVHAADLHLDTPFEGIGRAAPEIRARLRDASLDAFDDLIQLTIDRDASFLLLAGDLYDGAERGVRAQLRFLRGVERLAERGIGVFVVHGNHDPLDGWSAIRRAPPNLNIFGGERVELCAVERDGRRLATIYGISYARREVYENLALRFRREPADGLHIGLLHCCVGRHDEHASYSPCSVADLERAGMDYWALGHIHQRQYLSESAPWIVYPGNLQGRGIKSTERDAKGAVVVEADASGVRHVEFVALDGVRFVEARVDLVGCASLDELRAAIWEKAGALRTEHAGRDLLVQTVIEGRGSLHGDLRRHDAIDELLDDLRQQAGAAQPLLWFHQILDVSDSPLDRAAIAARGDFSAELLRVSGELAADPERLQAWIAAIAEPLFKIGSRHALETGDPTALLHAAEERALDLLEDER